MNDNNWQLHLHSAIRAFRLGMEAQGGEELTSFIDKIMPRISKLLAETLAPLNKILGEILAAQSRKDYLLVADLLEYEIVPFLADNLI